MLFWNGSVEIFQHNKSIRVLKTGDVFGLERVFLKKSLTTTARALSPVRIAAYQKSEIGGIAEARSRVITAIISLVIFSRACVQVSSTWL